MTNVTSNPRRRGAPRTLFFAACGLFILCMPGVAAARPYTVVSCDSAGLFGYSSAAWTPFGNAGSAYEACPTGGGSTAGVSNRLIGGTYSGFSHSGHVFAAPPGTTITQVRWSGRAGSRQLPLGRLHPSATQRSPDVRAAGRPILRRDRLRQPRMANALRRTRGHHPGRPAGDLRRRPMPARGNDPRSRNGSHRRRPDPTVDRVGRTVGERAVGERARWRSRHVVVTATTTPGSQTSRRTSVGRQSNAESYPCNCRRRSHARTVATTVVVPSSATYPTVSIP